MLGDDPWAAVRLPREATVCECRLRIPWSGIANTGMLHCLIAHSAVAHTLD